LPGRSVRAGIADLLGVCDVKDRSEKRFSVGHRGKLVWPKPHFLAYLGVLVAGFAGFGSGVRSNFRFAVYSFSIMFNP
jgi:hypothetical protein